MLPTELRRQLACRFPEQLQAMNADMLETAIAQQVLIGLALGEAQQFLGDGEHVAQIVVGISRRHRALRPRR